MVTVSSQSEGKPDIETAVGRIRTRGNQIAERESRQALRRLRARRDLSEREAEIIQELATNLAESLLDVPERHLETVRDQETDETARIVLSLFDDE
jgi:glutamyl-tRNA reductase